MRNVSIHLAAVILCASLACPSVLAGTMSEREVSDAMVRGYTAIKAQNFDGAKVIFASVASDAATSPRAPEAMMVLGALHCKTGDRVTGMQVYKALVEKYPDTSEAATVQYRIASEAMRTLHLRDAQDAFRAAAENKSISALGRGRCLLQVGFADMKKYFADEYWDRDASGLPVLVRPGLMGDRNPYLDSAKEQFQRVRVSFGKNQNPEISAIAEAAIGEAYLLSEKPAVAEAAYRNVLDNYGPVSSKLTNLAQYGLGQALYGQGNLEDALQQFDLALSEFIPGDEYGFAVAPATAKADLHAWKVLTVYGLQRFDEALDAAREGKAELESDPALISKVPVMELWEGNILCQMGRTGEGLDILHGIITDHPGTPQAAHAQAVISQFEEAN